MRAKENHFSKSVHRARTAPGSLGKKIVAAATRRQHGTMIFSYLYRCVLGESNVFDVNGNLR